MLFFFYYLLLTCSEYLVYYKWTCLLYSHFPSKFVLTLVGGGQKQDSKTRIIPPHHWFFCIFGSSLVAAWTIGCQTDLICFTCKQNGLSHCWFLWQLSCLEQGANETWVIGPGSEWVGNLCSGPWPQTLTPPLPAVLHMYAMAHYGDRAGGVDKTRQIYHLCQKRQLLLIGQ